VLGYPGKRVIVTGAASGIGLACATLLVDLGAEVHTVDVAKPDLPGIASFSACDVRDGDAVVTTVDRIGAVVNMLFECTGLARADLSRIVDATVPKMLQHVDSSITCIAAAGVTSYLSSRAQELAAAGVRMNGVALERAGDAEVATALVLLGSPRAAGLTGTALVPAAVLPRAG
jgi:NAD(P)-dependent dehydrogenase (short-subunit alcohol dehydrogenase family)